MKFDGGLLERLVEGAEPAHIGERYTEDEDKDRYAEEGAPVAI